MTKLHLLFDHAKHLINTSPSSGKKSKADLARIYIAMAQVECILNSMSSYNLGDTSEVMKFIERLSPAVITLAELN